MKYPHRYTKGPWFREIESVQVRADGFWLVASIHQSCPHDPSVSVTMSHDAWKENARLITQAPNMALALDALLPFLREIEQHVTAPAFSQAIILAIASLDAALGDKE